MLKPGAILSNFCSQNFARENYTCFNLLHSIYKINKLSSLFGVEKTFLLETKKALRGKKSKLFFFWFNVCPSIVLNVVNQVLLIVFWEVLNLFTLNFDFCGLTFSLL